MEPVKREKQRLHSVIFITPDILSGKGQIVKVLAILIIFHNVG
jgi:hypothetical protein